MKNLAASLLIPLLCLSSSGCTATGTKVHESAEPIQPASGVTVNRVGHPIVLPLNSLSGATFVGTDGELILYADGRGLYTSIVTPEDWGNPTISMNQAPSYIFERNFNSVSDPQLRRELEGIARITLDADGGRELRVMTFGETTAYIAFSPKRSTIMLSSPKKPNRFSQLVLDGFTWDEIEDEVLGGITRE